jgi:hypothetical protein
VAEQALWHCAEVEVGVAGPTVTGGTLVLAQVEVGAAGDPADYVAVAGDEAGDSGEREQPAQRARS